jgi:hypothetical protein
LWLLRLQLELGKAEARNDDQAVKQLLAEFRQAILSSVSRSEDENIFRQISGELQVAYNYKNTPFSLRSNNDVEDLLASGLYKSAFTGSLAESEIEEGLKKIWSSMYDFRAYSIRRYWGQREENLAMPVMVHPFVDRVLAHAVATFRRIPGQGHELEVRMVLGERELATNPSAEAQVLRLKIRNKKEGAPELLAEDALSEDLLTDELKKPLLKFFKNTYEYVAWDFSSRIYTPSSISLELVVQDKKYFWSSRKVTVLQYKPNLKKEAALALVTGELTREDIDKRLSQSKGKSHTSKVLRELSVYEFAKVLPDNLIAHLNGTKKGWNNQLRYALLLEEGKPFFVFWDSGQYHIDVKEHLRKANLSWIKSGYIKIRNVDGRSKLLFTDTTVEIGVDRPLLLSLSKKVFQSAFDMALRENLSLREFIEQVQPVVEFQTFEGDGFISVERDPPS